LATSNAIVVGLLLALVGVAVAAVLGTLPCQNGRAEEAVKTAQAQRLRDTYDNSEL
jgi:hypothetical protein